MQFLTPLFWLGAAAIAVPILLHLVRREKTNRIPFASLMFIRKIPIKELRRRRLTHLLLLFLRCLGILLVVAAFARPLISGVWLNQANPLLARSVVILLDRSLSMSRESVWESALSAAGTKIRSLTSSDEGMIIQFGETVEILTPWENSPEQLQQILQTRVGASFEATSYAEALRMAVEQFDAAKNPRKEIYLITDLQQNGMESSSWRVPPDVTVEIEDVGEEDLNLFVEEVRLSREFFTDRYPHPILTRVGGNSEEKVEGEALLYVEGRLIDRQSFEVNRDEPANLTFKPFDTEDGVSRGRIVLEPTDSLPADNSYYFVVEKQQPRRIAILQDRGEEAAFYLRAALSSGENLPFAVEFLDFPGPDQIDPTTTPLVILNDLARPPRRSLFESYVESGGGVIVILGNDVSADTYNEQWAELLPVELEGRNFVRGQNKPFTSMTDVKWEHPIFTIFQGAHRTGITSSQFYSYWQVLPREDALVVTRFNEGDPALIEKSLAKGTILVFTSSADPVWTDFPLRSAYVPFWYSVAQYATRWQNTPAAFRVNHVLPVQDQIGKALEGTSGTWNVIDPRGQRVLGLDEEHPDFVQLKLPGHYEIRSNKMTDWAAVNSPSGESDLARVSIEDFQAAYVPRQSRSEEEANLPDSVQAASAQQSLWWLLLIAAAFVLLTESWVASRSRRQHSAIARKRETR